MGQEGDMSTVESKVPVAEMFDLQGYTFSNRRPVSLVNRECRFENFHVNFKMPCTRSGNVGLSDQPYGPEHYLG